MRNILIAILYFLLVSFSPDVEKLDKDAFLGGLKISKLKNIPQNDVNCIYKDTQGFLWIGTLDGLHRFDGYDFKTFRVDDGINSISSNLIISIDEDSHGNIWIATFDKGLCKFNPKDETFTSYRNTEENLNLFDSNDFTCLMVDKSDVIWTGNWFGTSYRITCDAQMNKITKVEHLLPLPYHAITIRQGGNKTKTIFQDKKGNIWFGTNDNLYRCLNPYDSIQNLRYEHYQVSAQGICDAKNGIFAGGTHLTELTININPGKKYKTNQIDDNGSYYALFGQDSILWAGDRKGVHLYRKNQKNNDWTNIHNYYNDYTNEGISGNIVYCITGDATNQIWVGLRGGGISTFNMNRKRFESFRNTNNKGSISNNLCRSIFEDHRQNLWIGTEEGGLNFLPTTDLKNYKSGFKQIHANERLEEDRAYAIEEIMLPHSKSHKSMIWAGTSFSTNLVAIDPLNLRKKQMPDFIAKIGFVFAIRSYNDSVVWVGTYGNGLHRFIIDQEGNIIKRSSFFPDKSTSTALSSRIIRSLLKDQKGNLWIGTDKGLNLLQKEEVLKEHPRFKVFSKGIDSTKLNHDYILQTIESSKGKIWIGTMGGGLLSCNTGSNPGDFYFKAVTTKDGLPNNAIKSIVEDNNGLLWLSSNHGLSRYNPENGEIVNYDVDDGLQENEFSEICALKRKNGQIVFGGINGFNVFYPDEINTDTIKPRMFLTDFYILNKEVKPTKVFAGRIILENALQYTNEIKLKYTENSFSLGFVALQFNSPQKNKYKYKLEGFDKQWFGTSFSNRIAKYTNIPPGDYTFKVKGSNCDNLWSNQEAQVKIHIDQPFYLSLSAFIVYLILAGIVLWYTIRTSRIIALRKKEVLIANFEKNKTEEISQIKLRFFTNISHEFRTPLTLIYGPLESLIKNNLKSSSQERQQKYQLIQQNTNVLMRMVNQLMDFRKLDQNKLKISASKIDLFAFLNSIYNAFIPLAERKEIDFVFSPSTQPLELWIDIHKMENVMYNLLSNAFKFTPAKGKIEIGVTTQDESDEVVIFVKDTGIGIEKEESIHIFERYYQPDKKHIQEGSGIGLTFSKDLVELHHGIIEFESEVGKGSIFSIHLLKGNQHFAVAELVESSLIAQKETEYPNLEKLHVQEEIISSKNQDKSLPKILIVEDNPDLRQLLLSYFQATFQVFEAEDGEEGLKTCKIHYPEIVISDIMMPKMDGNELCRRIKNDEEISHIPVILLTAKNAPEAQIEGLGMGADNYVTKPFNMDVLHARIMSLINNRDLLRQKFSKDIAINPTVISHSEADGKFLNKILSIIENNLANSEFTVEQLATEYGVSRIYLNRKIKALTDETSNQFILSIRLKHAAEMLKSSNLTVSEVTWAVGYNDLKTFRNRFKDKFGVSPSEFQKNNNN